MERKEETIASKLLVDFIHDFTLLTEQQIIAVRKMMEETVREVMESVMNLSDLATKNKNKANEVLVHDASKQQTVGSTRSEVEKKEDEELSPGSDESSRRNTIESRLIRAGGIFTKHMEVLSRMDDDLHKLLSRVIGSVSLDDVMAQRLGHVIGSLDILQKELSLILADFKKYHTPEAIKAFRNRVLTEVYLSYTAESEREVFHQIFGHPREIKRVS